MLPSPPSTTTIRAMTVYPRPMLVLTEVHHTEQTARDTGHG